MASPPILDFDRLLAPIPGANPQGEPLPYTVRAELDKARQVIDPDKYPPNDPRRPEKYEPADWARIDQLAQDTLAQGTKDLLLAARLTEALVKLHGFGGLRDGLRFMRRLAQEGWDRIYPKIEDGDVEARAAPFDWLDDENRGALFPNTLRTVPLTNGGEGQSFGWQQWKDAQDAKGPVSAQAFDQAVAATPRDYCQTSVDDIGASVDELEELAKVLSTKMGSAAPGLAQVRKALRDCQQLAQHILQRKGPPPPPPVKDDGAPPTDNGKGQPQAAPPARRPLTREDVLNRLADASALLLQMEPHSPVAYMVQRAVKLARLPLPDLMRVLIRDAGVLGQLDRDLDLGIEKTQPAPAAPAAPTGPAAKR